MTDDEAAREYAERELPHGFDFQRADFAAAFLAGAAWERVACAAVADEFHRQYARERHRDGSTGIVGVSLAAKVVAACEILTAIKSRA